MLSDNDRAIMHRIIHISEARRDAYQKFHEQFIKAFPKIADTNQTYNCSYCGELYYEKKIGQHCRRHHPKEVKEKKKNKEIQKQQRSLKIQKKQPKIGRIRRSRASIPTQELIIQEEIQEEVQVYTMNDDMDGFLI